jgi:hypothetical protein
MSEAVDDSGFQSEIIKKQYLVEGGGEKNFLFLFIFFYFFYFIFFNFFSLLPSKSTSPLIFHSLNNWSC